MKKLIVLILAIILIPSMVHAFRLQGFVSSPAYALSFDGIDDFVQETASLIGAYPFSWAVTFRENASGQDGVLMGIGDASQGDVRYYGNNQSNGTATIVAQDGGSTRFKSTVSGYDTGLFVTNFWTFTSGTERNIYTSTESISSTDDSDVYSGNVDRWRMGSAADSTPSSFLKGDISDVKFFDEAVSEADAQAYIANQSVVPSGLVNHWDFHEGEGATVGDIVGSNDGTIDGATWIEL